MPPCLVDAAAIERHAIFFFADDIAVISRLHALLPVVSLDADATPLPPRLFTHKILMPTS